MNPEHKKYILDNIHKKSINKIAQELGLKERKIRRFLEKQKQKKKPLESKEEIRPHIKKTTLLVSILLIIILGFFVYSNSLNGEFIWDDEILIVDNVYIKDSHSIPGLFTKDITYGTFDKSNFYRPLQILTYVLNYAIGKLDTKVYHLTNIIFHILVAMILYWLINLIFKNNFLSLITSLLFVSHPIHTEAVSYISGRADPMAVLFMLLTMILYIKYSHDNKIYFYFLSFISYFLALLCKEIALVTPLLLLAYDYIYIRIKESSKRHIPFLLLGLIYIFLRKTVLNFPVKNIIAETTFFQRLPVIFQSLTMYFKKLLLPFDLHMEYALVVPPITNIQVILGILITLVLIMTLVIVREKEKAVSFSIAWFFINYLPISNIFPLNAFFAEHWIYTPSLGLFILAGWIVIKAFYKGIIFRLIVSLSLLFLLGYNSYLTRQQNHYWSTRKYFYERTLKYNPNSSRVYHRLSILYFDNGEIDKGIEYAKKALDIAPDFVEVHENLAAAYLIKGFYDMAIDECEKALKIAPNSVYAHLNLGNAYFKKGWNDKAIIEFNKVISINPSNANAHSNLGTAYATIGKKEEAITEFKRAIEINPKFTDAYINLGMVYNGIGRHEEAIASFKKALEINPNYAVAYYNLAIIYYNEKQYDLAIKHCDKAIELGHKVDPEFLKAIELYRNSPK